MNNKIQQHHIDWRCPPTDVMKDKMGRWRTKSLFAEVPTRGQVENGLLPVYSLQEEDRWWTVPDYSPISPGEEIWLPSAYLIYLSSTDEYEASLKLVGSTKAWEKMVVNSKWFTEGLGYYKTLEEWREDMRQRDEWIAKKALIQAAQEGNAAAAKSLKEYSKKKQTAGRPKKEKEPENNEEKIENLFENVIGLKGRK